MPFLRLRVFVQVELFTDSWKIEETLRASRVMAEAPRTGLRRTYGEVAPTPAAIGFKEASWSEGNWL